MHDLLSKELDVQLRFTHNLVNAVAGAALTFGALTLYVSLTYTVDQMAIFAYLVAFLTFFSLTLLAVLRIVVAINSDHHFNTVADFKTISFHLKLAGDEKALRIVKAYVGHMEDKPRMAGRLLGFVVTQAMVNRGVGACAVAMFSAIVRVGLLA